MSARFGEEGATQMSEESYAAWMRTTDDLLAMYRSAQKAATEAHDLMIGLARRLGEAVYPHLAGCDLPRDHTDGCRCRCGRPIADESPNCEWHKARAEGAVR